MWDSMCHTSISLISKALNDVDNAEILLKIKGVIALFIQTMDVSMKLWLIFILLIRNVLGLGIFSDGAGHVSPDAFREVCRIAEEAF